MFKNLFLGILFTITTLFITSGYADSSTTQLSSILSGKMLVVDMDNDGKVSKDTVISGSDLLLGTLNNDKDHKAPAFNIETINDVSVLSTYDSNHDGVIEQNELAKTNLVLIRFSPDKSITIIPLALSNIKEIHYQGGLTQKNKISVPLNVWLVSMDGKKYQTYYLNF